MLLPLGDLNKTVTREYANHKGFHSLAIKKDSLGICFNEGNDYRTFLKLKGVKSEPGNFVDIKGEIIGQRRGLGLTTKKPVFVSSINAVKNEIVLTEYKNLYKRKILINGIKFVHIQEITIIKIFSVKIRYRLQTTPCRIELVNTNKAIVHLLEPLAMVANGQTAVFYDVDRVVGVGFIENSE